MARLRDQGLSPRGALAAGTTSDQVAELFERLAAAAGDRDLDPESLFLAEELTRLPWSMGQSQRRSLALLVITVLAAARQGSTRLPLGGGASGYLGTVLRDLSSTAGIDIAIGSALRDIAEICRGRSFDRIVGGPGERLPLIAWDGCVYLERHFASEARLVRRLADRIGRDAAALDQIGAAVGEVVARPGRIAGGAVQLSDEQSAAIAAAAAMPLTVISGGPGTGKTAIAVALLRVLVRLGIDPGEIALAAPTGKAAQRLSASIEAGLAEIARPEDADLRLAEATLGAQTLHRLLGFSSRTGRFRHHRNHPLRSRFLIVDEASMIDLELMDRLIEATPAATPLVLLGDADQLPSVEAGAVLRELVLAGATAPRPGARPFAVRLTRSFRTADSSGGRSLVAAAAAIRAGQVRGLIGARGAISVRRGWDEVSGSGAELLESTSALDFAVQWHRRLVAATDGFEPAAGRVYHQRAGGFDDNDCRSLGRLFGAYERARLLTATRRGAAGCEAINALIHRRVLARTRLGWGVAFYPGEPIIVRHNDYDRDLFNGDQGMVVRVTDDGSRHEFRAVFRDRAGGFRAFVLDALRHSLELAFAITVHQSQGSEADQIALVLPASDIPLLSRELVYTAITRARHSALLAGPRTVLRAAIVRSGERFSGLGAGLGRALPPEPRSSRESAGSAS